MLPPKLGKRFGSTENLSKNEKMRDFFLKKCFQKCIRQVLCSQNVSSKYLGSGFVKKIGKSRIIRKKIQILHAGLLRKPTCST